MRFKIFILLFIFCALAKANEKICTHDEKTFRCVEYVRNYDGDTITFNIPDLHPLFGEKVNIRVNGVDTPEIRTKNTCEKSKAKSVKEKVSKLLKKAKRIDLINIKRGKYFRIVADVIVDEKSLSSILLEKGYAYPYMGKAKKEINWCQSYREIASKNLNE